MNEEILQEKLEKYVRGLLPTVEAAAFELEIAQNTDLQEQVRLHRLEVESTEYLLRENIRQQAKTWLAETPKMPQKKTVRWGIKSLLFLILAAALIGIGICQTQNNAPPTPISPETQAPEPSTKVPMADNPKPEPTKSPSSPIKQTSPPKNQGQPVLASLYQLPRNLSEGVLKSAQSAPLTESPLSVGILAYQSSDYKKAIQAFSAIKKENNPLVYALAQEWLAHSWFKKGTETGDFTPAAQLFQARVAQNTNDAAQDQAEWYWTLSLYGNYPQNKEKVRALLQKMSADEHHTYREKAADFLKEFGE